MFTVVVIPRTLQYPTWTFTELAAPFIPCITLSGVQSVSSTVYIEILPLCCVLFFMWRSSTEDIFYKTFCDISSMTYTYFVKYSKWIVFVQRKTFHTQPNNLIFMNYSITEHLYQLAEQLRCHKAWYLTCIGLATKINATCLSVKLSQLLDVWIRMAGKRMHKKYICLF